MKPADIQIGTTYRIRQWEDMREEHGLAPDGSIHHAEQAWFDPNMKYLCGREFVPQYMRECGDCGQTADGRWFISAFMLEPLPPAPSPSLRIGSFTIRRHDDKSLWIATDDGEGGQFSDEVVEEALREMYRKHNQGGFK